MKLKTKLACLTTWESIVTLSLVSEYMHIFIYQATRLAVIFKVIVIWL